jgi:hypothetical protein
MMHYWNLIITKLQKSFEIEKKNNVKLRLVLLITDIPHCHI